MLAYCHSTSQTLGALLLVACIGCAHGDAGMPTAQLPWGIGGRTYGPVTACRAVLAPAQLSAADAAPRPSLPMPLPPLPERLDESQEASPRLDEAFDRLDQASRQMLVWPASHNHGVLHPTRLPQPSAAATAQHTAPAVPPARAANQPPATSPWMR